MSGIAGMAFMQKITNVEKGKNDTDLYQMSALILEGHVGIESSTGQGGLCGSRPSPVASSSDRLQRLRTEMTKLAPGRPAVIEAYIITSDDEHQSEYVAERDKRLEYMSGYSGRVGQAVVTRSKAAIWVEPHDYWLADSQLDCEWAIYRLGFDQNPQITEWMRKELRTGVRVGADPKLIPASTWEEWKRDLEVNHIALVEMASNIVDEIWTENRPTYSKQQAFFIDGGETREKKFEMLRANLTRLECGAMVVTALDEIAWLLNVRGDEGPFIPFVRSYLIVTRTDAYWYLPREQKTENIFKELEKTNISRIRTLTYENIWKDLRVSAPNWGNVLVPSRCEFSPGASQAIAVSIVPSRRVMRQSPIIFLKARKNQVERRGMQEASLRDSTALVDFIANLEKNLNNGTWTELAAAQKLEEIQNGQEKYQGPASPIKIAFGRSGTLRNYTPSNNTINDAATLVVRTANHYLDGTTSMARTFHFGVPSLTEIQIYTKTLASLIEFSRQVFPGNLRSSELDVVGRAPLWREGSDYSHGTGHGIGAFSAYRESPINIDRNTLQQRHFLQEGYFITAGPSQSKPGDFGVELENVLEVNSSKNNYLKFDTITLIPFEAKLIEPRDLTVEQVRFVNDYHNTVLQVVGAELKKQKNMEGLFWLMRKTRSITPYCNSANVVTVNVIAVVMIFSVRYLL